MTDLAATDARARARERRGPDRLAVSLFSLTAFLLVLAMFGAQLRASAPAPAPVRPRPIVIRREYLTTVVTRIVPAGIAGPPSGTVTRTVSSPKVTVPAAPAPVSTRTSGAAK